VTYDRGELLKRIDLATEGVWSWTDELVCHLMFDLTMTYERPQVLEVACAYGKATAYLAVAAQERGGFLRAVDLMPHVWEGRTANDLVRELGAAAACDITLGCDARWYLLDLLKDAPDEWLDIGFLDASHTVEVDAFVALAMWTHLAPGGIMIFDDLDWTPAAQGESDVTYSRPTTSHVRAIFDYIRALSNATDALEWGGEQLGWPWGFVQKAGSTRPPLRMLFASLGQEWAEPSSEDKREEGQPARRVPHRTAE
jgi:predicted O-methyltransferase YrrM